MSSFTKEPSFSILDSGKWIVRESFVYYIGEEKSEIHVYIPRGFKTDFASIPKVFRIFLSPTDPRWAKASVTHDFLYSKKGVIFKNKFTKRKYSRKYADQIFLEAMKVTGTPFIIRFLFIVLIRLFGGNRFKK